MSTKRSKYIVSKINALSSKAFQARASSSSLHDDDHQGAEIPDDVRLVFQTQSTTTPPPPHDDDDDLVVVHSVADIPTASASASIASANADHDNDDTLQADHVASASLTANDATNDDATHDFNDDANDNDATNDDANDNDATNDANDNDATNETANNNVANDNDNNDDASAEEASSEEAPAEEAPAEEASAVLVDKADEDTNHDDNDSQQWSSPAATSHHSLPTAAEVTCAIQQSFSTIRTILSTMNIDTTPDKLSVLKPTDTPDAATLAAAFPFTPLEPIKHHLDDFFQYYSNLTTDDDEDVFPIEMAKKSFLYRALAAILNNDVPPAIVKLLLTLGAKPFIVAFHALNEGYDVAAIAETSIFDCLPGLGVNVSDIFDDYLDHFFENGCRDLQLPASFRSTIHDDCVSYRELWTLTSW